MALGYTRNPTTGPPEANFNGGGQFLPSITRSEATNDTPPLKFVTTTSTVAIDESSKRAIRKHASRYVYRSKPQPSQGGANPATTTKKPPTAAAGGQIHRFRLGPQGLKHTPNQPPQVSQNFTILSLKSDEPEAGKHVAEAPTSIGGIPGFGPRFSQSKGKIVEDDEEDEPGEEPSTGIVFSQPGGFSGNKDSFELVQQARVQQEGWLEPLLFSRGGSLFGPSSGTMDPFNAMALPITPREQILLRYYCTWV